MAFDVGDVNDDRYPINDPTDALCNVKIRPEEVEGGRKIIYWAADVLDH
jgi:hypothetical protein